MNMQNLAKNIEIRRRALGLSQQKLAELVGISQPMVQKLLKAKAGRTSKLPELARALNCTVEELIQTPPSDGELVVRQPEAQAPASNDNTPYIIPMSPWDSATPLGPDEVEVPLFMEVEMACGAGMTEVIERNGPKIRFARSTMRHAGVPPEHAACCFARGDSMEPTIPDGATVGIDTSDNNLAGIADGEIYAIDHGGLLRIKYLYRLPRGGVRIRSEKRDYYPDEDLYNDELSDLRIIGRVFWISTIRRKK